MTKSENKQAIVHGERTRYKADCIVANEANSVKLVLQEETIDKVNTGKSYHIENCKIKIFVEKHSKLFVSFCQLSYSTMIMLLLSLEEFLLLWPLRLILVT